MRIHIAHIPARQDQCKMSGKLAESCGQKKAEWAYTMEDGAPCLSFSTHKFRTNTADIGRKTRMGYHARDFSHKFSTNTADMGMDNSAKNRRSVFAGIGCT